ncbi:hypothetical protein KIN20_011707 [Parelaphostrongylus tenuis]|uniref:Uncharacterized protein n=1 Tax=Parelaphostrongylus tenuis TaxID=148309 RepID=A0AAD5MVF3_PARTN|nr:hypothetical protein KIN20_011707 [Parelaphostrongylus tenuis]
MVSHCTARGGSHVSIQNVHRGVDLLTAIRNRYADSSADENVFVINSKAVELFGMQSTSQKQSNVFELRHIVLESCSVAGPPPETCPLFRKCVSLNLFNNLLQRWEDVRKILVYFPRLRELVLRKNRMGAAGVGEAWTDVKCLTDLILSDCGLTSESISNVLCYLPGLRTLLEKLSVVNCDIERIVIGTCRFPSLTTLNIKDNVISDWDSINKLQLLPKLTVLYINCENLQCIQGISTHEVIIAKLPRLVDLNRFIISAIERHSAEVHFLDKYFQDKE